MDVYQEIGRWILQKSVFRILRTQNTIFHNDRTDLHSYNSIRGSLFLHMLATMLSFFVNSQFVILCQFNVNSMLCSSKNNADSVSLAPVSHRCEAIARCDFNLHFCYLVTWSVFLCTCWPFGYLLLRTCIQVLCPFLSSLYVFFLLFELF